MRIACANWSRRHAGGIETYLAFVLQGLDQRRHQVALWSERDEPAEGVPVALPRGAGDWCAATATLSGSLEALRDWRPAALLIHGLVEPDTERQLLEIAPAVFVAHSYYGTCISGSKTWSFPDARPCARVFGPACLAAFYPRRCGGLSPITMLRDYRRQSHRLTLLRSYATVLTLSEHMRDEYVRHGLDPSRVRTLPPFVPSLPGHIQTAAARTCTTRLLYLGRLDQLKGCGLLISALPMVAEATGREVHLVVAGDGPDRARCQQLANGVAGDRVRVEFTGWIRGVQRARALSQTTVLVLPSIWPEPYGLSGLEAVSAGVPVAAFASGGIPEWLKDGITGCLAPSAPASAEGLAHAVVRCLGMTPGQPVPADALAEYDRRHLAVVEACLAAAAGDADTVAS